MMQGESKPGGHGEAWPELPLAAWRDTCATLHMWTQIAGKVRMALSAPVNHWWHVVLYVTPRGLSTSAIPHGAQSFEIEFDFLEHQLSITTSARNTRSFPLRPMPVAEFYRRTMTSLKELGIEAPIWPVPVEVEENIPFDRDEKHAAYDPEWAARFWRVLLQADRVLKEFRSRFIGKASPVHFFWGAFDLAVTRFSGRTAPEHPGGFPNVGQFVMREAYSHQVSSAGFWPGGGAVDEPAFYAYAYPEPDGFRHYRVEPAEAYYHDTLREFVLPYEAVRTAADPDQALLRFLQTTYDAAAELAHWDRAALERA